MCATCLSVNPQTCTSCLPGYYLDNLETQCIRCHPECLTCFGPNSNDCLTCIVGFYHNAGSCLSCDIDNCVSCSPSLSNPNSCDICRLGFVFHPTLQECVKCITGCTHCKYDKVYECQECSNGFEPIINVNGVITKCKPCPLNCIRCQGRVCLECRLSLRLVNNTCAPLCKLPCK